MYYVYILHICIYIMDIYIYIYISYIYHIYVYTFIYRVFKQVRKIFIKCFDVCPLQLLLFTTHSKKIYFKNKKCHNIYNKNFFPTMP